MIFVELRMFCIFLFCKFVQSNLSQFDVFDFLVPLKYDSVEVLCLFTAVTRTFFLFSLNFYLC